VYFAVSKPPRPSFRLSGQRRVKQLLHRNLNQRRSRLVAGSDRLVFSTSIEYLLPRSAQPILHRCCLALTASLAVSRQPLPQQHHHRNLLQKFTFGITPGTCSRRFRPTSIQLGKDGNNGRCTPSDNFRERPIRETHFACLDHSSTERTLGTHHGRPSLLAKTDSESRFLARPELAGGRPREYPTERIHSAKLCRTSCE
jgi:hypothetical protein